MKFDFLPRWILATAIIMAAAMGGSSPALAQDDFLTHDEVDAVRDAQEPEQRIPLYLEIADIRLGSIRAALASVKPGAGRAAQKKLVEYNLVMEALETTIDDARTKRSPFPKAMELLKKKLPETKNFLESLDNDNSPLYADYQFTLKEAVDMTADMIAEVARGMFPEVDARDAPKLPSAPPRPEERRKPAAPAPGDEGGPPRKAGARQEPTSPSPEEGPPRKSNRQ